jgi:hypothetical protein
VKVTGVRRTRRDATGLTNRDSAATLSESHLPGPCNLVVVCAWQTVIMSTELGDQVVANRASALFRELLVEVGTALRIGMAGDDKAEAVKPRVAQGGAQPVKRDACIGGQIRRVIGEVDIEIDRKRLSGTPSVTTPRRGRCARGGCGFAQFGSSEHAMSVDEGVSWAVAGTGLTKTLPSNTMTRSKGRNMATSLRFAGWLDAIDRPPCDRAGGGESGSGSMGPDHSTSSPLLLRPRWWQHCKL